MSAYNNCRFCGNRLKYTFVDLGTSPLANSYLKVDQLQQMEPFYSLHVYVCEICFLVQLPELQSAKEIFNDYAYFSSYSESWLKHAKTYSSLMIERFGFDHHSLVVEIASNDGYLLQYFKENGIPVLGVEPAKNVAKVALEAEIPTITKFFGTKTAQELANEGKQADLLLGNNVLAHVPDLNDFVAGLKCLLKTGGLITMEFPHLLCLIDQNQFDTIYHEHFSYFSFITVEKVFQKHGLTIFDVDELPTHGGSLRVYARHNEDVSKPIGERVSQLRKREENAGFTNLDHYLSFTEKVKETKRNILDFMITSKREGKTIAGYGAPAKGNTSLNFCGIRTDFIDYTVDRSPHKQGHFLPGTHIPIYSPDKIKETRPDYLVILPWNIKDEIMEQMTHIRDWEGKFVVMIPEVRVL
ncbi:MAG: class I SAM-dependent methyltransferase [Candidatus Scalindua sp. AMX11]|nr:MAG: class I SAM-dependent methyltransferase [Candidatus Scalindua sp.]NOG82538.1 methyltransferase domain-containing protein [Planctomycetota bacterium]RZV93967.1 MAG: class I SAM-dependent methyltransferase [Candidatus Scalindua sp. SCAELEC01]TDE63990.1 MAG: class I SAM-dependent methyltransferase [Candidatus Scalindua sp. AMX11]GJQ58174.1 MAG: methyltransferase [Candidatus Scalindua sp.]